MNPLYLQIPTTLGFSLQTIPTYAAAFTPYVIAIVCIIALIILAAAPGYMQAAREIDEALDFRSPSGKQESSGCNNDPGRNWNDITTKTGGGVTSLRPHQKDAHEVLGKEV